LYTESWFNQYEFNTRKAPHRRAARSSATDRKLRANFNFVIPQCTGFPYT
jgi:hypothetical protein